MLRQLNIPKEIAFCKVQIKEHMLFIYQGLVDDLLKPQAVTLHQVWHKACEENIKDLIEDTLKFQYILLDQLKHGPWIGWLSVSFVNHLIKETEYFKSKLLGEITKQDEIKFWLWHHYSECEAAEKLLNPTEEELSFLIKDYVNYVKTLEKCFLKNKNCKELQNVLDEYLNQTMILEKGILNYTIYSNISPILINHVIREGYYAIDVFKY